ncbi:hypothetical protein Chor_013600 [Crotalus horridus]
MNLGQRWGDPSPTASLLIDLRRVTSAASSFDFRTFDPEGVIFFGDTNPGFDWFVLALHRGKPIMQIHNSITVKNEGHIVMLLLDGEDQLTLSHVSHPIVNQTTPQMRIGVGGLFILPTELLVPLNPALDGCIRRWDWLNTSQTWQEGASLEDPGAKVCLATVQRGSFFPGDGLAVFQVSGLPVGLSPMDWRFSLQLRIRAAPQLSTLLAVWAVEEQRPALRLALERTDLTAELGNQTVLLLPLPQGGCLDTPLLLLLTPSSFTLRLGDTEVTKPTPRDDYESLRDVWLSNMGNLVIGGASGEGKTPASPRFQGCLNTVRVQDHELDFDDAQYRSNSIWAHSCPGNVGNKVDVDDGH